MRGGCWDESDLFDHLAIAVDEARYWERPDVEGQSAEAPQVLDALRPVAACVVNSPRAAWSRAIVDDQHSVSWLHNGRAEGRPTRFSPGVGDDWE